MTHLNPTHPLTQTLCLLLAIGCASRIDIAKENTGGDTGLGGSTSATGGDNGTGGSSVTCSDTGPGCAAENPFANAGGSTSSGGNGAVGGGTSVNPTTIVLDNSRLSTGDNNAISTGGYWWTYTDHNADGSQFHSTISQVTSEVVALTPTVDGDPSHGNVIRVSGLVPPMLPWTLVSQQDSTTIDTYWKSIYPDSMIPAYPTAGVGFGFLHFHSPFDATGGGKWVGIAFDMKANVDMPVVWVSMPMVGTDLPDPNFSDAFPKQCQYYTGEPGHTPADGGSSCFAHYREGIFSSTSTVGTPTSSNTMAAVATWKRYCVLYSQLAIPNWANATTLSMIPQFDPTRLLKVQWDMYQPNQDAAHYDISLDNVSLVTPAQARDAANNCDVSRIGQMPGTGTAG